MTITVEQLNRHIAGVVAEKCPSASPGQRAAIVEKLMQLDAAKNDQTRHILLLDEIGVTLDLQRLLREQPELIKAAPTAADLLAHRVAEYEATAGAKAEPHQRLQWSREIDQMDADARLASGVEAGSAAPASTTTTTKQPDAGAFHSWSASDDRFDAEIQKRWGYAPGTITMTKRAQLIAGLQGSSRAQAQERNERAADELNSIEATGRELSPKQRLDAYRLANQAK